MDLGDVCQISDDVGPVHEGADEVLRLALDSMKSLLAYFKFKPSQIIPYLQLQSGYSKFPAPKDLTTIFKLEREDDMKGATLSFFDVMLQDTAPPEILTHFMQSLLKANKKPHEIDAAPWHVHDIITLSCAYMPLQLSLLRLLGKKRHEEESPVHIMTLTSKLCQVRLLTPQDLCRVLETTQEFGHREGAVMMLLSLYSNTVENLCEVTRDRLFEGIHDRLEDVTPEWVPKLVELIEQQAGPEIRQLISQEVLSTDTWQSARDKLSFRKNLGITEIINENTSEAGESIASDVTVTERARDREREEDNIDERSPEGEIILPEGPPIYETKSLRIMQYLNNISGEEPSWNLNYIHHEHRHVSDKDDSSSDYSIGFMSSDNNVDSHSARGLASALHFTVLTENSKQITLHAYQEELLRKARQGKNVLIFLPTGTGKTFIVMKYTQELLSKPELVRVVFLAPKVKLVEQQFLRFRELMPTTTYLRCGTSRSSNAPLSELLDTYTVFVMTPQCLVEAIQNKEVKITDFSLMILDECHHTHGGHAFKMLMDMFVDAKFEKNHAAQMPQVIGLTASPGVGKGGSLETAISHLKHLCYDMDVEAICTVKENVEELKQYINEPRHEIHDCPRRRKDMFKKIMEAMMNTIETKMRTSSYIDNYPDKTRQESLRTILTAPALHRGQQAYSTWVYNISNHLAPLDNDSNNTYIMLFSCAEMLQKYHRALILNEDCESHYALDYLKEQCRVMRNNAQSIEQTDRDMLEHFDRNLQALESACNDAEDYNPKLRMLEDILLQILENEQEQDAACMVFVRTLELSKAIHRWIQSHPQLSQLNPGRITSFRFSSTCGGMTKSEVSNVMAKFNLGEHKAVVCTSAAEEGLDFQACNVVVRYDFVTNMIAMIQTRGRARRKDSQYLVLGDISHGNVTREKDNLANERLMKQAIDKLQSEMESNPNSFREQLLKWQEREWCRRKAENQRSIRKQAVTIASTTLYDLLCRKCKTVACSSADFKLLGNSSRIVVKEAFKRKLSINQLSERTAFTQHMEKVARVYCKSCGHDWGILANHIPSGRGFPVLKLESFLLRETGTTNFFPKKVKWNECPFHVRAVTDEELMIAG